MLAVKLVEPHRFEMQECPIPEPAEDEVLIKNMYLGICTSDVQIYQGKHAYASMPVTMGHEISGVIEKVGMKVTEWEKGDRVVVQPQLFCGKCPACRNGHFNVCEDLKVIGVHTDGCACEYVTVPAENLHTMPDSLTFREAALAEPLAVGFGVVRRIREIMDIRGKRICIVGAGVIGNFVAQACRLYGAEQVLITDVREERLCLAQYCGINFIANTSKKPLAEVIEKYFGTDRADIIVDSAATPAVFQSVLNAARSASVIVISGNYKESVPFDVTRIQRREITLLGHMMYGQKEFDEALTCLSQKKIKLDGIITQEWNLNQYPNAFHFLEQYPEQVVKMVVRIGEDQQT